MKNKSCHFLQSNIIDIIIAILSHSIFNFKHLGLNIYISHSNNLFNGSSVSLIVIPAKASSKGLPSPVPHLVRVASRVCLQKHSRTEHSNYAGFSGSFQFSMVYGLSETD